MRQRELKDPETGKTWSTCCEGAEVRVRSGLPGKEKESVKTHLEAQAAVAWAKKEEWTRLKKGFILDQALAAPGQPRMHRYRGRGYTGALAVADVRGELLCNAHDESRPGDRLFLVSETGAVRPLPEISRNRLAWKACYLETLDTLLVLADHQVLSWDGVHGFEALCEPNPHSASCLDAVGRLAVWYAEPDLVVTDLATGRVLMKEHVPFEYYGNHSAQMEAALSPDGRTVAYCARPGEIVFRDVGTGRVKESLSTGCQMIVGLTYSPDGRFLIVAEQYGEWRNLCFDLETMSPRVGWPPSSYAGKGSLALSPDGRRLAIADRTHIEVIDFISLQSELRFRVEHMVKRCALAWVGPWLGVQTDYGCASLYAVDPPRR